MMESSFVDHDNAEHPFPPKVKEETILDEES